MNIRVSNSLLNNNSQVADTSVTQQTQTLRPASSLASQISDMNVGDVFTGKITDLNGQTLQLLLSDKSQISAKLSAMMKLNIGQTMSFEVTQNSGGKVQLTPLYANLTGENQVAKALGEAGLPYDARTSEMVKSMMEQGMKIDADSLLAMARTVNNYPDAAPASIVNMKALNIPLNPDNVQQFEIYRNNAHQIAEHVGGIAEGFAEVASESPTVNNMLLQVFTGGEDPKIAQMLTEAKQLAASGGGEVSAAASEAEGSAAVMDAVAAENAEAAQLAEGALNPEVRDTLLSDQSGAKQNPSIYGENTVTETLEELYTPEEREALASDLEKLGVPKQLTDNIRNNEMSTRDVLNLTKSAISQGNTELSGEALQQFGENVKHMLKTPEYGKLVKNEIMNELLLKPENVADKEKVQEYFQKVVRDTAHAAEVLQSTGRGDTTLAAANQNLHDNIDFMNQMNQLFTYVQLPLKMASEAQHGDLYVYTNKKKLAQGDGNVSALLHLDMTNLGTMDIHVSMNPEGVVNTHFILQNEGILDFVAEHLPELDERINRRGYHMHSDVSLNAEKKTVPEIMFDKGKNTKLIQFTSFDAKA